MILSESATSMDTTVPVKQKPILSSQKSTENMRSSFYFGIILFLCVLATWLFARIYREIMISFDQNGTLTMMEYSWFFRLCMNLAGYATVLLPGLLLYKYLQRINYFDKFQLLSERRLGAAVLGLAVPGAAEPPGRAAAVRRLAAVPPRAASARAAVQLQLLRAHQHRERVVPVRGAQVRQLPHAGAIEVVQGDPGDAHGQAAVPQPVPAVRVPHRRRHLRRHGAVHAGQPRQRRRVDDRHVVGAGAARRVHAVRQLHLLVAGPPVQDAQPARTAHAHGGGRELVERGADGGGAVAPARARRARAAAAEPDVRVRRPPAVRVLGGRPAAHLPHHREVRRRRVRHHHDLPTGGIHPALVPGVRSPRVVERRGRRAGRVPRRGRQDLLPPATTARIAPPPP